MVMLYQPEYQPAKKRYNGLAVALCLLISLGDLGCCYHKRLKYNSAFRQEGIIFQKHTAKILNPPMSVNATEGESVMFFCIVKGDQLEFIVDGERVLNRDNSNYIVGSESHLSGDRINRSLEVVSANQSINVTCRAFVNGASSFVYSSPAVLLVQGPLSAVGNLSYSFVDSSTVNVSWNPPFTLLGTVIEGFNITIQKNSSNVTNEFTTVNFFLLYNLTSCEEVNVSIAGFNKLNGIARSILIEPPPMENVHIPVAVENLVAIDHSNVNVILQFNFSRLCPGQHPTLVNLTILYTSNGTTAATFDNVPLVSTNNTNILTPVNTTILLPSNSNYTVTVSDSDRIINSSVTFSTWTLWVTDNDTTGPFVEFICHFSPYSDAVGCLIKLLYKNDTTVQFNSTGTRTGDDVAMVTIDGVDYGGTYRLLVYEIGRDRQTIFIYRKPILIILPSPTSKPTSEPTYKPTSKPTSESITPSNTASVSPTTSPTNPTTISDKNYAPIIVSVVMGLIMVIAGMISLILCYCRYKLHTRRQEVVQNDKRGDEQVVGINNGDGETDQMYPHGSRPMYNSMDHSVVDSTGINLPVVTGSYENITNESSVPTTSSGSTKPLLRQSRSGKRQENPGPLNVAGQAEPESTVTYLADCHDAADRTQPQLVQDQRNAIPDRNTNGDRNKDGGSKNEEDRSIDGDRSMPG